MLVIASFLHMKLGIFSTKPTKRAARMIDSFEGASFLAEVR
jgi:hypothetical protein